MIRITFERLTYDHLLAVQGLFGWTLCVSLAHRATPRNPGSSRFERVGSKAQGALAFCLIPTDRIVITLFRIWPR